MVTLEDMNDIRRRLAMEEILNNLHEKSIYKGAAGVRVMS